MVSKCANPLCSAPFRTLREGRLVVLHLRQPVLKGTFGEAEADAKDFEPFWLCEECCDRFTLLVRPGRECVCIPKPAITGECTRSETVTVGSEF
jgi:hypothetical protein